MCGLVAAPPSVACFITPFPLGLACLQDRQPKEPLLGQDRSGSLASRRQREALPTAGILDPHTLSQGESLCADPG